MAYMSEKSSGVMRSLSGAPWIVSKKSTKNLSMYLQGQRTKTSDGLPTIVDMHFEDEE